MSKLTGPYRTTAGLWRRKSHCHLIGAKISTQPLRQIEIVGNTTFLNGLFINPNQGLHYSVYLRR